MIWFFSVYTDLRIVVVVDVFCVQCSLQCIFSYCEVQLHLQSWSQSFLHARSCSLLLMPLFLTIVYKDRESRTFYKNVWNTQFTQLLPHYTYHFIWIKRKTKTHTTTYTRIRQQSKNGFNPFKLDCWQNQTGCQRNHFSFSIRSLCCLLYTIEKVHSYVKLSLTAIFRVKKAYSPKIISNFI